MPLDETGDVGEVGASDNQWVYEIATGKWMLGFRDPSVYLTDKIIYAVADLGAGAPVPNPLTERYDSKELSHRRPATTEELADAKVDQHVAVVARLDMLIHTDPIYAILNELAYAIHVLRHDLVVQGGVMPLLVQALQNIETL